MKDWVKVGDSLPEQGADDDRYVWASWNGAGDWNHAPKQGLARYLPNLGWQPLGHMGYDWNVTHWMPLPAPPEN